MLVKGQKAKTKGGISQNIATEERAGKRPDVAIAIAYSEAKEKKSKKGKKK